MNPEDIIKQRYETDKTSHQRRFELEWNNLSGRYGANDPEQLAKMRDKLLAKHQQEAMELTGIVEQQLNNIREIELLVSSGQATPQAGAEQSMRSVLDTEAERAVFPQQEQPISRQYSAQLLYRDKLDSLLAQYEDQPGGKKTYWGLGKPTTAKLKMISGGNKKDGYTFRDATTEEIQEYGLLKKERDRVAETMNVLLQDPDMSNRLRRAAASSGRKMGISESFAKTLQDQRRDTIPDTQQPKYQVNRVTGAKRVSYDGGKTWQPM